MSLPPTPPPTATLHMPSKAPNPHTHDKPWHAYMTLDVVVHVLQRTIFHPFIAFLIPLCLRAQATPYSHPAMISTIAWAMVVTAFQIAMIFDYRIAQGPARPVSLEDEVVLVTGGAGGLGGLIAEIYGLRGVSVAVLDVERPKEDEGETEGGAVEWYECDVSDLEDVRRVREKIVKDLGHPSIIINCAATSINGRSFIDLSPQDFLRTINVNFIAAYNILKTYLPAILESGEGGTFVTISSVLAQFHPAYLSDYAASKAALSTMHNSLVMEMRHAGHENVKGLLVEPGQIGTRLFEGLETPNKFLAPVLETREIAKEIVAKIDAGDGGLLRMPYYASWVDWYSVLPWTLQLLARWFSSIDTVTAASNIGRNKQAVSSNLDRNWSSRNHDSLTEKAI